DEGAPTGEGRAVALEPPGRERQTRVAEDAAAAGIEVIRLVRRGAAGGTRAAEDVRLRAIESAGRRVPGHGGRVEGQRAVVEDPPTGQLDGHVRLRTRAVRRAVAAHVRLRRSGAPGRGVPRHRRGGERRLPEVEDAGATVDDGGV